MEKRSYEQLDLRERIEIYRLQAEGKSLRFIAGVLGRNVATLSRELKRNSKASKKWPGGYDPQRAQEWMLRRHARGRAHKLARQPELRKEVFERLAEGWSPEQIAGRMAQGPARPRISYESIYRYIYWRTWSFKETLHRWLPRQKGRRGKRLPNGRWSSEAILDRVSIHDRPSVVEVRTRSGDLGSRPHELQQTGTVLAGGSGTQIAAGTAATTGGENGAVGRRQPQCHGGRDAAMGVPIHDLR
jgi:IS30 family transposase